MHTACLIRRGNGLPLTDHVLSIGPEAWSVELTSVNRLSAELSMRGSPECVETLRTPCMVKSIVNATMRRLPVQEPQQISQEPLS